MPRLRILFTLQLAFLIVMFVSFRSNSSNEFSNKNTLVDTIPKKYKVEYTELDWSNRLVWLDYIAGKLEGSDLPSKEVKFIRDSLIVKFQNELRQQLIPQVMAAKDTTNKKPKK